MATVANTNRITGLFSGIDTDSLVKAMSLGQQSKIDVLSQKKQQAEWKKDILTDFNNKLRVFRETYGSVLGEDSLMSKGTYANFTVNMADNAGVRIVASASAKAGSYNVRVDQIATASTMKGSKLTSRSTGLTEAEVNSTGVGKLSALTNGAFASENIEFSINGVDFSFTSDTSLKNIMDTVNKSKAGVTMSYTQTNDSVTIVSNSLGAYKNLTDPGPAPTDPGTYTGIRPNRQDYADGGAGDADYQTALETYQTAYDNYQNTVVAQYKADLAQWTKDSTAYESDGKKTVSVTDTSGFLSHLGLNHVTNGQDAIVYLNGESEARHLDVNSLSLDGVQMTFLRATGTQGVDYTLESDSKPAVEKVKKFVDAYNTLMKEMYTAYNEKVNRDYKPLTDEQRESMSEKEIELWEQKAKEGMLYRDNNLGKLLEKMRGVLTKSFGDYGNLASVGITSGKYMIGEPVQLELDEDKLLAALEENPDRVYNLFSQSAGGGAEGGLMTQFNVMMDDYVNTIKSKDIQNLTNNINSYTKNIKEQETKLTDMSERYYIQYAQLETALAKMQSQQNAMSSLFGGGTTQ